MDTLKEGGEKIMKCKKHILPGILIGCLLFGGIVIASRDDFFSVAKVGDFAKTLRRNIEEGDTGEILLRGEHVSVQRDQYEQSRKFYLATGLGEKEASESALVYCKEFNSLYHEAIRKNYDVSDGELEKYIDEMRENFHSANVSPESVQIYRAILKQFDSEDQYWEYQKKVYQKQLPIEKMNRDLEEEFYQKNPQASSEDWEKEFQKIKDELVLKENFHN